MTLHCAVFHDELDDVKMAVHGSQVQRKCPRQRLRVRRLPPSIHFRHQPLEHAQMSVAGRQVDDSGSGVVDVTDVAVGVFEEPAQGFSVADGRSIMGGGGPHTGLCGRLVGR